MIYEMATTSKTEHAEHAELIDMRTHLTVAMLAAAQLARKTKQVPEAEHLQAYLGQSLKSLVGDVEKVDALVTREEPALQKQPARRRRGLLGWLWATAKRCALVACEWVHRRRYARISALYLTR